MSLRTSIEQAREQLQVKLDALSLRDKIALGSMLVVLVIAAVWQLHRWANAVQTNATEQRETLLWMRSQAPNIQSGNKDSLPLSDVIQNTAQQQGLTVALNPVGDKVQVDTSHQNFAVLGSWLSRLAEQGVSISQLDIEQVATGELKLKAVMQKGS